MRAVDIFGTTCKSFWNEDGSNMFIGININEAHFKIGLGYVCMMQST